MIRCNPWTIQELPQLPPRSITRLQPTSQDQPIKHQEVFGTFVTAVYSAILREIQTKGKEARFVKTDRGRFAANA